MAADLVPGEAERKSHSETLEAVRSALSREWPNAKVHLFGEIGGSKVDLGPGEKGLGFTPSIHTEIHTFTFIHPGSAANDLCICNSTDIDVTMELPDLEDTQV